VRRLRDAAHQLGEVVAQVTSTLNPQLIVLGGALGKADAVMLAGVREVIYHRVLPLATKNLHIQSARVTTAAASEGAAMLAIGSWLSSSRPTQLLS
jgi:predicted NBD/HSP70 family sugar kinase